MAALIKGNTGDWEIVIGLEIHAQVTAQSKLFYQYLVLALCMVFIGSVTAHAEETPSGVTPLKFYTACINKDPNVTKSKNREALCTCVEKKIGKRIGYDKDKTERILAKASETHESMAKFNKQFIDPCFISSIRNKVKENCQKRAREKRNSDRLIKACGCFSDEIQKTLLDKSTSRVISDPLNDRGFADYLKSDEFKSDYAAAGKICKTKTLNSMKKN